MQQQNLTMHSAVVNPLTPTAPGPRASVSSEPEQAQSAASGAAADGEGDADSLTALFAHWADGDGAIPAPNEATAHSAACSVSGAGQSLPFLEQIQKSFGPDIDLSGIQSHADDTARDAATQLGTSAFALGNRVAFAGTPTLHQAAHEAAHVIQQRAGWHVEGGPAGDAAAEGHADEIADRVVRGESVVHLLPRTATALSGRSVVRHYGGRKNEPAAWAAHTHGLIGNWAVTTTDAAELDPSKKDARGAWRETGATVPKGTRVYVAGAVETDGAVRVVMRGSGMLPQFAWLHHYQVQPSKPAARALVGQVGHKPTGVAQGGAQVGLMLNDPAVLTEQRRMDQQKNAAYNLGRVDTFQNLYKVAGALFESLVPAVGDTARITVDANIPLMPFVSLSLRLEGSIERDSKGLTGRLEAQIGVLAKADLWLVDVFARAALVGFVEVTGDHGEELVRYLFLVVYDKLRGTDLIDDSKLSKIFGSGFVPTTVAMMDKEDEGARSGLGVELSGGISLGTKNPRLPKVAVSGAARILAVEDYHRKRSSLEYETDNNDFEVGTTWKLELKPFSGSFSLVCSKESTKVSLELAREAELSLNDPLFAGDNLRTFMTNYLGQALGNVISVAAKQAGYSQRPVVAVLNTIKKVGFGPDLALTAVKKKLATMVAARAGNTALKFGQMLGLEVDIGNTATSGAVRLSNTNALEIGENERSMFHLLLESSSPIVYVPFSFPNSSAVSPNS